MLKFWRRRRSNTIEFVDNGREESPADFAKVVAVFYTSYVQKYFDTVEVNTATGVVLIYSKSEGGKDRISATLRHSTVERDIANFILVVTGTDFGQSDWIKQEIKRTNQGRTRVVTFDRVK